MVEHLLLEVDVGALFDLFFLISCLLLFFLPRSFLLLLFLLQITLSHEHHLFIYSQLFVLPSYLALISVLPVLLPLGNDLLHLPDVF